MWRNHPSKPQLPSNYTLDPFLKGIPSSITNNTSPSKSIIPKIKVPASSGLQSIIKPITGLPFMYPCYPEFREYQYTISIKCVTQNTLVCLPTGLGKTHIASVLIVNFHIWFPQGLIFFLAPTKPLVDQQSMSLSHFNHLIPKSHVFSLTGSVPIQKRAQAYKKKKILFCTPQTLQNDLKQGRINPKQIVLLIFDQAHKAIGNYAYPNIIKFLDKQHFGYRILALSATPGNDNDRIQQVIDNLQIANMIVKTDDDNDVKKYIKNKKIQPIFIQFTDIIKQIDQILRQFIRWPLNQLLKFRLFDKNLAQGKYGFNANCFYLINQQINQRLSHLPIKYVHIAHQAKNFLKFVSDSQSILRYAGYQSFKRKFIYQIQGIQQLDSPQYNCLQQKPQKLHKNYIKVLKQHPSYIHIKQLFTTTQNPISHPKLQKLRNLLYTFFTQQNNIQKQSKVIVFAHLRYTCHQIHKYINQFPYSQVIKSQIFLGQSKTTIQTRSGQTTTTQTLKLSQKQQIDLIKRYKSNQINTLISTSIGQQGLDIGQVDAIFCYQGGMSSIRMIQRMGRTGRKRDGIVYMLLMQGKQTQDYQKMMRKNLKIKKINSHKYKFYSYNPVLFQQFTQIPIQFFNPPSNIQSESSSISISQKSLENNGTHFKKFKNTKKRSESNKNKQDNDGKNTKKKNKILTKQQQSNPTISQIQQATKSQQNQQNTKTIQNSEITNLTSKNTLNQIISKYIKKDTNPCNQLNTKQQNKFFKIIGNQHINADITTHLDEQSLKSQEQLQVNSETQNKSHQQQQQQQQLQQQQYQYSQYVPQQQSTQLSQSKLQLSTNTLKIGLCNQGQENNAQLKKLNQLFDLDKLLSSDTEQQQQYQQKSQEKDNYQSNISKNNLYQQSCLNFEMNHKQFLNNAQLSNSPKFGQSLTSPPKQTLITNNQLNQQCPKQQHNQQLIQGVDSPQFVKFPQKYPNNTNIDDPQIEIDISEQTKRIISLTKYMRNIKQSDINYKNVFNRIIKEQKIKNTKQQKSNQPTKTPEQNTNTKIQKSSQTKQSINFDQQQQSQQFGLQQKYDEFQQLFEQHNKIKTNTITSQSNQLSYQKNTNISIIHQNQNILNNNDQESDNLSQLFKQHQIIYNYQLSNQNNNINSNSNSNSNNQL